MSGINLSYILTTYNKLPFLKHVLGSLIDNCKPDEEIIVTDGGSNDGTNDYLISLFNEGKINKYVSEKDFGESHGLNKGLLMAKGELIRFITDDDVFYYPAINNCKNFMLQNKSVEIVNTNGGWGEVENLNIFEFTKIYQKFFETTWTQNRHPFAHCALGLIFRRDVLAKIGFLGVGFSRADAEFTLRFTSVNVSFYWYTGLTYVRILNEASNSLKMKDKIEKETKRLNLFYGFDIDKIFFNPENLNWLKKLKQVIQYTKNFFLKKNEQINQPNQDVSLKLPLKDVYLNALNWLEVTNRRENKFIGNEKKV